MRQVLICISKEAMVDLEKARQPKALYQRQKILQVPGRRYLTEETTDCVNIQSEECEWCDSDSGKLTSWNKKQNFLSVTYPMLCDVLDRNEMKGNYMLMRNAPICTPAKVRLVETRGYNVCIFRRFTFS